MTEINQKLIKRLKHRFNVLNNESRLKILFLCKDKELSVTEISRRLNLSYTTTSEYTGLLEREQLISKRRKDKETLVKSLVDFNEKGEVRIKH